jgi:hypothetical protein
LIEFSNDVLKNKYKEILGDHGKLYDSEIVDWEYAKIRTSPDLHKEEDLKAE